MTRPGHAVLSGDVGGTHTRLALVAISGRTLRREVLESRRHASLEGAVKAFLAGGPSVRIEAAAIGVAGPVLNGRCRATNLPWAIDERRLAKVLGGIPVTLMNDLVALAHGAAAAPRSRLRGLGGPVPGKDARGTVAVIAAGTGLGEAVLVWDGHRLVPCATEGGHADFAPRSDLEIELLQFLRARHAHVSFERVLSGPGLWALYRFFVEARRVKETPANERALRSADDPNVLVADLGVTGRSEAAVRAVELFSSIYGAEAGNLALKALAVGGVYVCGSIAGALLSVLSRGAFRRAFVDKGRLRPLMERIRVAVVLDTEVGLAGATRVALTAATL